MHHREYFQISVLEICVSPNIVSLKGIIMHKHTKLSLLSVLLLCAFFARAAAANSPDMVRGLNDIKSLVEFSCEHVYPKPSDAECIDRVLHGIGASFDPHSEYLSTEDFKRARETIQGAFGGLGIEISKTKPTSPLVVMNVMDDTPAQRAGLLAGDIISHIIPEGLASVSTVSLKSADDAVKLLRGAPDTPVTINVIRPGVDKPLTFTIPRKMIKIVQIKGELLTSGAHTYALIENKRFQEGNRAALEAKYAELEKRARQAGGKLSGLIITFENNGGGLLYEAYNDIDLFLDAPSTVLIRDNDGINMYTPHRTQLVHTAGDITNGLPILIVVNSASASASEVFAAAMKHFGRAVIAGTSRTYGKGIVQTIHNRPQATAIKLTSSEYVVGSKDDWTPVQCVGIEPDILFEYPGIRNPYRPTECEVSGHVGTGGPMANPPLHRPIKEANLELYKEGETMLEAYKAHMLPKLLAEEEKRKKREAE
jgi:carboxyl-terminal processing protease